MKQTSLAYLKCQRFAYVYPELFALVQKNIYSNTLLIFWMWQEHGYKQTFINTKLQQLVT